MDGEGYSLFRDTSRGSSLNLGRWSHYKRTEVHGCYAERWKHIIQVYTTRDGFKSDWRIEKREDTVKPYVLMVICTGQRYGVYNKLKSAKMAAYLHDFG